MRVENWAIERVRPYEQNPRLNDEAVSAVARSIQEFGFRQPIVVDEEGVIIVGHTRWKAAQQLGLEKVPVHVAKGLTPAQIKAYRIADNQAGNIATWDTTLLPLELADLQGMEFDLDLLGFDQDELARLLATELLYERCVYFRLTATGAKRPLKSQRIIMTGWSHVTPSDTLCPDAPSEKAFHGVTN